MILNLTPDHLGRHGDMDGYAAAKARLFDAMGPTDLAILPAGARRLIRHAGSKGLRAWTGALPGVARLGDRAQVSVPALEIDASLDLSGLAIPGAHNRDNAAVAALIAMAMGAAPDAVAEAMSTLKPLAHRMEVVGTHRGVVWINDSKATNIEAARVGLSGLDDTAVVLLGGQAKGPSFGSLSELLRRHRAVVCFGASGPSIAAELDAAGLVPHRAETLVDALTIAAAQARPGDVVLLSPGTASFDEFDNFEHRGRVFAEWVRAQMEDR